MKITSNYNNKSQYSINDIDHEIEEWLTVRDIMVMSAEQALILSWIVKPYSFEDVFWSRK